MYIISLNSPNSPQNSFGYYFHFYRWDSWDSESWWWMEDLTAGVLAPSLLAAVGPRSRAGFQGPPEWSPCGCAPALPGCSESQDSAFPKFLPLFSFNFHCLLLAQAVLLARPWPPPSPHSGHQKGFSCGLCFGPLPSAPKQSESSINYGIKSSTMTTCFLFTFS